MKNKRHKVILSMIQSDIIQTQEELVDGLRKAGFDCTQGTISRDIRELGLSKVLDQSGVYKYAQPNDGGSYLDRLKEVFAQSVLSVVPTGNLIIIKTIPAGATAAASAVDVLDFPYVLGCIAGDDTIFVAVPDNAKAVELAELLVKMAKI